MNEGLLPNAPAPPYHRDVPKIHVPLSAPGSRTTDPHHHLIDKELRP